MQAYDNLANLNSVTNVTVRIMQVNDQPPIIYLDGDSLSYQVNYTEDDDPVLLSNNLTIMDEDVGVYNYSLAEVAVMDGKKATVGIMCYLFIIIYSYCFRCPPS